MAKCMLIEKGIPLEFWVDAVNTGVYILNRCPTKTLDKKTLFEAYNGKNPGIKHLKVFGSMCYAQVPSQLRQTLDVTSSKCIFLGYGTCEKGYRLYSLETKKMIAYRDVIFNEDASWDWNSKAVKEVNVFGNYEIQEVYGAEGSTSLNEDDADGVTKSSQDQNDQVNVISTSQSP